MVKYADYIIDNNFHTVRRAEALVEEQFKTTVCLDMFRWWQSFLPNRPKMSQFDIIDHVKAAPNLFLIEVLPEGKFEYRLQGEDVAELIGSRNKGKVFSKASDNFDMANFADYLGDFVQQRKALHSLGELEAYGRSTVKFEAFDMPLFDEGCDVSHVLGIIVEVHC